MSEFAALVRHAVLAALDSAPPAARAAAAPAPRARLEEAARADGELGLLLRIGVAG